MAKKRRILIADDSAYHRFRLKKLLLENEFDVYEAEDGVECIQLFRKVLPDLVITDINMPVMDGIESIEFLKRVDPDAKIIVFSSLDEESMVMSAFKAGAKDYIVKPLNPTLLMKTVRKYLGK
jgi:two-component system, chemotaxis family, chemotaxis protein CheY